MMNIPMRLPTITPAIKIIRLDISRSLALCLYPFRRYGTRFLGVYLHRLLYLAGEPSQSSVMVRIVFVPGVPVQTPKGLFLVRNFVGFFCLCHVLFSWKVID